MPRPPTCHAPHQTCRPLACLLLLPTAGQRENSTSLTAPSPPAKVRVRAHTTSITDHLYAGARRRPRGACQRENPEISRSQPGLAGPPPHPPPTSPAATMPILRPLESICVLFACACVCVRVRVFGDERKKKDRSKVTLIIRFPSLHLLILLEERLGEEKGARDGFHLISPFLLWEYTPHLPSPARPPPLSSVQLSVCLCGWRME